MSIYANVRTPMAFAYANGVKIFFEVEIIYAELNWRGGRAVLARRSAIDSWKYFRGNVPVWLLFMVAINNNKREMVAK